jgi:hypothetical protein
MDDHSALKRNKANKVQKHPTTQMNLKNITLVKKPDTKILIFQLGD